VKWKRAAWKSFFRKSKTQKYRNTVADLVQSYEVTGWFVFKGTFLRVSCRLLPRKSRGSEQ